jgi:uncharacterized protein with ATP-grasp and redox domains
LIRQTLDATRHLNVEDATGRELLRRTLELLPQLDWDLPPPAIAREIHRSIRELTDDPDPYLCEKISETKLALELLPSIEGIVAASDYPFLTAVLFSIAGNAIDLGATESSAVNVNEVFRQALTAPVDNAAVRRLETAVRNAKRVLFLADNAGEIVFDRPLLEKIGCQKVTVAVRGAPVINDATLDDAERSGVTKRFHVISNGSDTPGTWLSHCSAEFIGQFEQADLVIAKGQGNYETLIDHPANLVFLFIAKCAAVAEELGVETGRFVVRETQAR